MKFSKNALFIDVFIKKKNSKTSKNRLFLVIKLDPYSWHYFGKAEKKIKSYSVPDLEYPILGADKMIFARSKKEL